MNLGDLPSLQYVKVTLPDCFSVDFSGVIAKVARANGVLEYTGVTRVGNFDN